MTLPIVPATEKHVVSLNACFGDVAAERKYMARFERVPVAMTSEFVRGMLERDDVLLLAVDGERVVGWCDIASNERPVLAHVGVLGIGVHAAYRGQGLGKRLLAAALDKAFAGGVLRVELEVFATNPRAIALYEQVGFVHEGTRRQCARLDAGFVDIHVMGLLAAEYGRTAE